MAGWGNINHWLGHVIVVCLYKDVRVCGLYQVCVKQVCFVVGARFLAVAVPSGMGSLSWRPCRAGGRARGSNAGFVRPWPSTRFVRSEDRGPG